MTTPADTRKADRINFAEVAERADLRRLIEADCGAPNRSGKFHCPFHDDQNPSLGIHPEGHRWKCWGCDKSGDALDWLMLQEGIDVVEAAKKLDPSLVKAPAAKSRDPFEFTATGKSSYREVRAKPEKAAPGWHELTWQAAVDALVVKAERALWGKAGADALGWLRRRGLDDHTIGAFRLGFLPEAGWTSPVSKPDGTIGGIYHERGILIPWAAPGSWYGACSTPPERRWCGANVRRLNPDVDQPWDGPDKCRALRGSERGFFYPWPDILATQPTLPAVLVEGEIDALVGVQEASWIAHVGTVGGAGQPPQRASLATLATCPWWLIATDHDGAGIEAVWAWRQRAPRKARRLILPRGKDVAEFHQSGGNVLRWLESEMVRVGICSTTP